MSPAVADSSSGTKVNSIGAVWTLVVLLLPAAALAHQPGLSYSELAVGETVVSGRLRLALREVADRLQLDRDGDGVVTKRDLALVGLDVFRPTLDGVSLTADGAACLLTAEAADLEAPDGLVLTGRWTCPHRIEHLQIRMGFIATMPPGHTHLSRVEIDGRSREWIARAGSDRFAVENSPRWTAQAARFLVLGVEHIFTGYDHIAFLLGLLLLGGTLRALVKIVSSFTVAHSVTLALAALGIVTPPQRVIEPLIAASIVFVALENLWAVRRDASPDALRTASDRRWRITFAFGLVHGFGFASVLRQLHLPRSALVTSLVAFNVGVEVGQIAIVGLAFPLLLALRRSRSFVPRGLRVASVAIGALGVFWLVQRAVTPS
jgi:hypothetical protein